MKTRKLLLYLIDSLILAGVFILTVVIFGASDSISIKGRGDFVRLLIQLLFFESCVFLYRGIFSVYGDIWRYARGMVFFKVVIADFFAGVTAIIVGRLYPPLNMGFGGTLCVFSLNTLAVLTSRFLYQLLYNWWNGRADTATSNHKINIAIVGAGNVGAILAEELTRNPQAHYTPICFIDTDNEKAGKKLNGLPVYKESEEVIDQIRHLPVQEIVIALPDISSKERHRLYDFYIRTGCKIKLYDYPISEQRDNDKRSLREIRIEDLLFRDSITFDNSLSKKYYRDKVILITGGGGSIGSELCRQMAKLKPKKLVIFDIYENNAYDIQQELIRRYGTALNLDVLIGSVRDPARLEEVFREVRPQVVFHAAAHKHVPLMERSGEEAIKNNVFGTYNTANMAEKYGVERFVLISTDKAVNPTNIMGASKRLCEMVVQCRGDSKTQFVAVRFGNVLGSNGSVIPLFRKQIEAGGPVTITDKRIIRYFMTIPEAAQLVMQAGAIAQKGELFVLDMGRPVKIYDLALNMIRLSGRIPGKDIEIQEVGLRPGEKLYEELLMRHEELDRTDNDLIFIERDTPYSREAVDAKLEILRQALATGTTEAVREAIKQTVPTFCEPEVVNARPEKSEEMREATETAPSV